MRKGYLDATVAEIVEAFQVEQVYNVEPVIPDKHEYVPGDFLYVVVQGRRRGTRLLTSLRWGWNPVKRTLFNTQIEAAGIKRTWMSAYAERRCVVPFNQVLDGSFQMESGSSLMAVAGIFDQQRAGVSLLTTAATGELVGIRERQPLIVPDLMLDRWLDRSETDPDSMKSELLRSSPCLYAAW